MEEGFLDSVWRKLPEEARFTAKKVYSVDVLPGWGPLVLNCKPSNTPKLRERAVTFRTEVVLPCFHTARSGWESYACSGFRLNRLSVYGVACYAKGGDKKQVFFCAAGEKKFCLVLGV